ncbi:glycosyltransferase family 2 protein [Alistipes sp.]|uniref:glycosyltransferase family 2 protein n=1 Tax=Alistipes sp. TaxID=1872444 RepID=UPI003AF15E3B
MRVSIVTCTYNSAATVADTIDSVNRQTYPNIEHIIIDGLSKDATIAIVKEKAGPRQRIFEGKDKGIYDAFNKGIQAATGEIVGVLNSDDFFTNDHVVSQIVEAFEQGGNELDAIYGDLHYVSPTDLSHSVRYYSSAIFRPYLMRLGFMPAHPTCYIRKRCYDRYGLYNIDYKIAADFELLLRYILINRIRIAYISMDFVTMRTGGASTQSFASRKLIMREQLKACRDNGIYTNIGLLCLRYPHKIMELLRSKISNR